MKGFAAVVLAAGQGRRLGRGPKAFVAHGSVTLLERAVFLLQAAGIHRICAVLPAPPDPVALPEDILVARNPKPDSGPLESVRIGLESLESEEPVSNLLIHPVDHPEVEVGDIDALVATTLDDLPGVARVVPTWKGKGGHPILVTKLGVNALRTASISHDQTLRDVLNQVGGIDYVDAQTGGVVLNWNRPEDAPSMQGAEF